MAGGGEMSTREARRFRKKPIEVEAMQFIRADAEAVATWCGGRIEHSAKPSDHDDVWTALKIPTLEGTMTASLGDYVIRGVQGEFYPVKPDIFEQTYEPSTSEDSSLVHDAEVESLRAERDRLREALETVEERLSIRTFPDDWSREQMRWVADQDLPALRVARAALRGETAVTPEEAQAVSESVREAWRNVAAAQDGGAS